MKPCLSDVPLVEQCSDRRNKKYFNFYEVCALPVTNYLLLQLLEVIFALFDYVGMVMATL